MTETSKNTISKQDNKKALEEQLKRLTEINNQGMVGCVTTYGPNSGRPKSEPGKYLLTVK